MHQSADYAGSDPTSNPKPKPTDQIRDICFFFWGCKVRDVVLGQS